MVSPILRKHRMVKPPDKTAESKPFLVDETIGQPQDTLKDQALSSSVPTNQATLRLANRYRDKDLPELLRDPIKQTRTFFLQEIAPIALAVSNGLMEAREVLKEVFQEEPDTGPYTRRIEDLAYQAMEVKMVSFVEKLFKLSPEESKRFIVSVHAKELKSDDLAAVISRLIDKETARAPMPDVPRRIPKRKKGQR